MAGDVNLQQLRALEYAVFDEFGKAADDRVHFHFADQADALRATIAEQAAEIQRLKLEVEVEVRLREGFVEREQYAREEIQRLTADAARLRRLGFLVEAGDWGIQYGAEDAWVDDGAELAKLLDSPEWVAEAEINERVFAGAAISTEGAGEQR